MLFHVTSASILMNSLNKSFVLNTTTLVQMVNRTCHNALSRGTMPVQAKANNLQPDPIPNVLSTLNALERRLISLRVPFMKMVQGPAVNVPSKLDSLCTMLPRLPTETELIALKLKHKLKYKGHYMYDYVSPEKLH